MNAQATMEQWQRQLDDVRARAAQNGARTGVVPFEQAREMQGLDIMQALLEGRFPRAPIAETLDFQLVEVERGQAVFQGTPQQKHLNPMGTVHGGWYATLLDSAVGCAVQTMLAPGQGYTTAELSVNLVRGARLDGGPLRAIGTVLHCGRQLATAEGKIVDAHGRLYAHATTTCLVFEAR
ncbi:PaaI family thioesterase [Massilia sp. LXY-6]|uniref:PaaI family thioesterase n=1 Tax=Massilia sp. LXY-6 TaxID=3379823 RepID=UPI003EE168C7